MKKILIFFILSLFSTFVIPFTISTYVYAATDNVNVVEDLLKDVSFDVDDYPPISDDYSLDVIQIAESKNKDLYLYVYQPSDSVVDFIATSVNIYYGYSHNGIFPEGGIKKYDLVLVSSYGVFDKYLVEDFDKNTSFATDGEKFINIVEINRPFIKDIDQNLDSGTITEKAFSIGQQWKITYINNSVSYKMVTFDTVTIDTILTGSALLKSGLTWGTFVGVKESQQAWFYVFDVQNFDVTHIFDADLSFSVQTYSEYTFENFFTITSPDIYSFEYTGDPKFINQTIYDSEEMIIHSKGLFGQDFVWDRIQKGSDFIKSLEKQGCVWLNDSKSIITDDCFVFSFYETPYEVSTYSPEGSTSTTVNASVINDVDVLRLHFQTPQGTYNLGVISDTINIDRNPIVVGGGIDLSGIESFLERLIMIVGLILFVVFLVVIINFIKPIFAIFKLLIKAIVFVICLPFKWLKKLIRGNKRGN